MIYTVLNTDFKSPKQAKTKCQWRNIFYTDKGFYSSDETFRNKSEANAWIENIRNLCLRDVSYIFYAKIAYTYRVVIDFKHVIYTIQEPVL